jgi:hypothetical protein
MEEVMAMDVVCVDIIGKIPFFSEKHTHTHTKTMFDNSGT